MHSTAFDRVLILLVMFGATTASAQTQPSAPPEAPPAIRRWVNLQHVHLSSRFRWVESSTGRITSSTHQWQPQVRASFVIDSEARYSIQIGAFGGSNFVSGWNNTGGGIGDFAGDFNVKQLFLAAEPLNGLEFQVGGLYFNRGENTEVASYDNDAYIVGERLMWRKAEGRFSQVAATVGHIGDFRTPNVFRRFRRMDDVNYGQLLVGARFGSQLNVSADYTYEDGRDILRQAVAWRMPALVKLLTAVRLETYQRVSEITGHGANLAFEFRVTRSFAATTGVAHIDRNYLIPGYMSPNADRYERGTRFYTQGNYAITRDLSIGWFQGEAFNTHYEIPNEHRFEVLMTVNPTATLKAKRIF